MSITGRAMQRYFYSMLLIGLFSFSSFVQANPVACYKLNIGNFCIELFEQQAPITVANFLSYINDNSYIDTVFHRSVPGFVLQGGSFRVIDSDGGVTQSAVNTREPIINEFGISNTRSTIAMAKLAGDPDSATSGWFVSLADNSTNLDNQNGGFTVFGQIVFGGMKVIDEIATLPINNFGGGLTATPTKDFNGQSLLFENFIRVESIHVTNPVGIFNEQLLSFIVEVDGNNFYMVSLRLVAAEQEIVFELNSATAIPPQTNLPTELAIFSSQNGTLSIPSVMISEATVLNNVLMTLTDANIFQFTLQSLEQAN